MMYEVTVLSNDQSHEASLAYFEIVTVEGRGHVDRGPPSTDAVGNSESASLVAVGDAGSGAPDEKSGLEGVMEILAEVWIG